jgi:hypothetical protein
VEANGQPGAVTCDRDGHVLNVFALDIADGQVQAIRCVVNPDKLRHLGQVSELARKLPPESPLAFHPLPASPGARAEDHGQDPERDRDADHEQAVSQELEQARRG